MRILVADDERDLVAALEELLKHERYTVDAVYTGQGAYDYASTGNYDCIILDIMLPDIDGLEVLRRLRAAGIKTPILLLTAKSDPADRILGLDRGADDYLPKPFVVATCFWTACRSSWSAKTRPSIWATRSSRSWRR